MLRSILWSQFHFSLIYGGEREKEREREIMENVWWKNDTCHIMCNAHNSIGWLS